MTLAGRNLIPEREFPVEVHSLKYIQNIQVPNNLIQLFMNS
jgi:hypothetical protein